MSVFTRAANASLLHAAQKAESVNGLSPKPGTDMFHAVLDELAAACELAGQAAAELSAEWDRLATEQR